MKAELKNGNIVLISEDCIDQTAIDMLAKRYNQLTNFYNKYKPFAKNLEKFISAVPPSSVAHEAEEHF